MNITDKSYPYPVLTPDGDDYENSEFDVALEVVKEPDKITLKFSPTLKDNGLRRLIGVEKAAKIIVHVESPMTVYRRTFDIPLPVCDTASEREKTVVEIPAAELSGVVSVCPFIVASQDIPAYTNEAFNPDYEGEAFSVDCGAVLAEGPRARPLRCRPRSSPSCSIRTTPIKPWGTTSTETRSSSSCQGRCLCSMARSRTRQKCGR